MCACACVCECVSGPTAGSGTPALLGSSTVLMETDQPKSDWTASLIWNIFQLTSMFVFQFIKTTLFSIIC